MNLTYTFSQRGGIVETISPQRKNSGGWLRRQAKSQRRCQTPIRLCYESRSDSEPGTSVPKNSSFRIEASARRMKKANTEYHNMLDINDSGDFHQLKQNKNSQIVKEIAPRGLSSLETDSIGRGNMLTIS